MLVVFVSNKFKILRFLNCNRVLKENREKAMNLTVLQRISWYNFVYFSLIYVLPPNDRVLCSFVITERIPTSRPLINLTLWSIPPNKRSAHFILFYFILFYFILQALSQH